MTRTAPALPAFAAALLGAEPDTLPTVAGFMTASPSDNKKLKARADRLTIALRVAIARGDNASTLAIARRLGALRPLYATYLPVGTADAFGGTCPPSCAYVDGARRRGVICYAGAGNVGIWAEAAGARSMNIVVESAARPVDAIVRHAVSGNPSPEYVRQMHAAGAMFPGQTHFTYVHDWSAHATPQPSQAPNVCVNASCDTATELGAALAAGFDAVIVAMPGEWQRLIDRGGSAIAEVPAPDGSAIAARVVACPEQRADKAVNCATCRALCTKPGRFDAAGRPVVVAFDAHSATRLIRAATIRRRAETDGRLAIVE